MQEPQEMQVQPLGREDTLEEGKATPPPTPAQYSCLENSHGQSSPAGCSPFSHKESDMTEATWHRHRQETNNNKSNTYNTNLFTLNLPPPPAPPSKTSSKTGLYSLFPIHYLHSTELPLPRSATPSMVPNLMSISTSSLHLATLAGFASWPLTF